MPSPSFRRALLGVLFVIGNSVIAQDAPMCEPPKGMKDPEGIKCMQAFCEAKNACATARNGADAKALAASNAAQTSTAGKILVKKNAEQNRATNTQAAAAYNAGKDACVKVKPDCDSKCTLANVKDPAAKAKVTQEQKLCNSTIQTHITDLMKAAGETGRVADGSGNTGDAANGNENQNPTQQQPQQAQSPKSDDKSSASDSASPSSVPSSSSPSSGADSSSSDDDKKQAADPCNGSNAHLYSQCKGKIAEDCKNQTPGAIGFASADPKCAKLAATSDICARFKQQCATNTADCLKTMTAGESAKIQKQCLSQGAGATAGDKAGQAGFAPASVNAPVAGGAGGGGGSLGGSGGAKLTDLSGVQNALEAWSEGGGAGPDMKVDSSGGYSSSASQNYSDPADSGNRQASDGERHPASDVGSFVKEANAKDVGKRFAPSIFSISSEVIQHRCEKGRHNHCGPNRK